MEFITESLTNNDEKWNFGLNQNCSLKEFSLNKEDDDNWYINIIVGKNNNDDIRPITCRLYELKQVYDKNNNIVTDQNSDVFKKELNGFSQTLIHWLSKFVSLDKLKTELTEMSQREFLSKCVELMPTNYSNTNIDIFLQYQWNISGTNTVTFLELPKRLKGRAFVSLSSGKEWEELRENGLKYIAKDTNEEHPFKRNKWFMESNFAIRQELADNNNLLDNNILGNSNISANETNNSQINDDLPF